MEAWQNDPVVNKPQGGGATWENDPVVGSPKLPDTSGVQQAAQQNLAANDNKDAPEGGELKPPMTPQERLNTAVGVPLPNLLNPQDQNAIPKDIRKQYTKSIQNGTTDGFGDFMQNALHSIVPMAARAIHPIDTAENTGKAIGRIAQAGLEGVGQGYEGADAPFSPDAESNVRTMAGAAANIPFQAMSSAYAGYQAAAIKFGEEIGDPSAGREIAMIPEALVGAESPHAPEVPLRRLGPWDNLPGADVVKQTVAQKVGKEPEAVTSADIDHVIAQGVNDKAPLPQDFKAVETVSEGKLPEKTLHIVYNETGVKPDQVFLDAQNDPKIAEDISVGKVPEAYDHLTEPSKAEPEKLSVAPSDTAKAFNVIDSQGDYVHGGFDSAEEARHFIEDERFKAEEREAIENEPNEPKEKPVTEKTSAGEQVVIPGAEKISDKNLAQRVMSKMLGSEKPQKAPTEGLFDTEARKQGDIFEHQPVQRPIPEDNYSKNLSEYSPVMYRETSPNGALELLPHGGIATEVGELHLADTKDMATGQGKNKGVLIAFDTKNLKGARNKSKPTADLSYSQGFGEYYGKHNKQSDYQKAVSAVRIDKEIAMTKTEKAMLSRTAKTLEEKGWKKTETDKYVEYTRPQEVTQHSIIKPKRNIIPPSETGRPTSLRTFLTNNGARFNESGELLSIKKGDERVSGLSAIEYGNEIAKEHGYLPKDAADKPSESGLQNLLHDQNGGRTAWREADADRLQKAREEKLAKENSDPAKIEQAAHSAGIDTEPVKGETEKQRTLRLLKSLQEFYKNTEGSLIADAHRKAIGATIIAMEKFTGKLTGNLFQKLGEGYIKTFAPELMGDIAKRADAYMAKYKASKQEAENSFHRESAKFKRAWDKKTDNERMEWLYDHETGRWDEVDDPDHARYQALLDATFKAEKSAIGADASKGYKENYLPHEWENPDAVKAFFGSDAMLKKYGKDGFTKASTFQLIQDGIRAGFKLKSNNPESMLISRLIAGHDMMATMDLLKDMEDSGIATRATSFGIDKKIAKTQEAIKELETKYQKAFDKVNNPNQTVIEGVPPAESKLMKTVKARLDSLNERLENFTKEKEANKLPPETMKELKGGFKIIGPDSKVWNIHEQVAPLWKNAMDGKGLWERDGLTGDAYRAYMQGKAIWVSNKLALSLFHPLHIVGIHLSSGFATAADHLIQGGKFSDLDYRNTSLRMGLGNKEYGTNPFARNKDATLGFGRDHPAIVAWNTAHDKRTPEQHQIVQTMIEGGFKPAMSAQDAVHFRENFDKAINGIGPQNLRLVGSAFQALGGVSAPLFQHWIPALKSEAYLYRANLAMKRDPSLVSDAGKRGETLRAIAKDIDRNYGEMNQDTLFWDKTVRDAFNAATLSGGWKLAMLQNFKGLAEPAKVAYDFAKTGEFSKDQITHQMLQSYVYTAVMLMQGAIITKALTGAAGGAISWVFPDTGDKNPDGSEIRLTQPAFMKEGFMWNRDVNEEGVFSGTGKFLYHQTLIPGIADTLQNKDFIGRTVISNPTDLNQWASAGWDSISPITLSGYEKADEKGSGKAKYASILGFPLAGAYVDQSAFVQKVLHTYSEQNPPKIDAYTAKLKGELKSAVIKGDDKSVEETEQKMRDQGMTDEQISSAEQVFSGSFVDVAWKKLSEQDQKRLISNATEEEKERFELKGE